MANGVTATASGNTAELTPIEEELLELAESDSGRFFFAFRRLRDSHALEVTRACLRHVAHHGADASWQKMRYWIVASSTYVGQLLSTEFLDHDSAIKAALILRDADPQFLLKLRTELANYKGVISLSQMERTLRIYKAAGNPEILLPWLRELTVHGEEHLRSKAAKVLCEMRPNVAAIERQMKSEDARVRANALEALWLSDEPGAVAVFRAALSDTSHRVLVNAIVGLHRLHVEGALDKLIALGSSPVPLMRQAAVWGMQFLADLKAVPALRTLAQDALPEVSGKARHALNALGVESIDVSEPRQEEAQKEVETLIAAGEPEKIAAQQGDRPPTDPGAKPMDTGKKRGAGLSILGI